MNRAQKAEFNRLVESENRSGIRYAYKYYGNDDHGSVPLMAEYDALRFIFDGYKLDVLKSVHQPARIMICRTRLVFHIGIDPFIVQWRVEFNSFCCCGCFFLSGFACCCC